MSIKESRFIYSLIVKILKEYDIAVPLRTLSQELNLSESEILEVLQKTKMSILGEPGREFISLPQPNDRRILIIFVLLFIAIFGTGMFLKLQRK